VSIPWKASVSVFTTTQALTKRSKVIPGGGPYPAATGPEATYFCSTIDNSCGESLYPKLLKAEANSCPSIEPERSRSKCLNTSCQSLMYRQSPWNSLNPMVPLRSVSKMFMSILTVSRSNFVQFPLTKADCSSVTVIDPDLSVSTAENQCQSSGSAPAGGPLCGGGGGAYPGYPPPP